MLVFVPASSGSAETPLLKIVHQNPLVALQTTSTINENGSSTRQSFDGSNICNQHQWQHPKSFFAVLNPYSSPFDLRTLLTPN
jgi:hypothetical protein